MKQRYWLAELLFLMVTNNVYAERVITPNSADISHSSCQKQTVSDKVHHALVAIWGMPAPEFRLALGMWSVHPTNSHKGLNGHNNLFGFSYKGFFAGSLMNSFYERAYVVGIQRYWVMRPLYKEINYEMGFRLGLITGYKGHNVTGLKCLKDSNVVPFEQIVFGLNYKYLGWEISTPNPSVVSMGFYIRFN